MTDDEPDWLIDEPSPFDSLEVWRKFLKSLEAMQQTGQIRYLVDYSKEMIAEIEDRERKKKEGG